MWSSNRPMNEEGERPYVMHYLVDRISHRCFATVAEPRNGNLLFVTDIRVAGVDRSYVDLEAAKSYCEMAAIEDDLDGAKDAEKNIRSADAAELLPRPRRNRLRKLLRRLIVWS